MSIGHSEARTFCTFTGGFVLGLGGTNKTTVGDLVNLASLAISVISKHFNTCLGFLH